MTAFRRAVVGLCVSTLALLGTTVAAHAAPTAPHADAPAAGRYVPLTPARLLDTRSGQTPYQAPPGGTGTLRLHVLGVGGVPADGVGAVMLNVTVPSPAAGGYISAYPYGTPRPVGSTVNFAAGHTAVNLALAKVGSGGDVLFYNAAAKPTNLIVDVSGYYTAGSTAPTDAGALQPIAPDRILDTRNRTGGSEPAGHGHVTLKVTGARGLPTSGIGAVAVNVTATSGTANGPVTVYPNDGLYQPGSSNLNYVAGRTLAVLVIVPVAANGTIILYNGSAKPLHLIADVTGYFRAGQTHAPDTLNAAYPQRVLDTRGGIDSGYAEPGPRGVVALRAAGHQSLPPTGVSVAVLSVTVTSAQHGGHITVYAGGTSAPSTSNVNFEAGQTVANLVLAPVSSDGVINLYNASDGKAQIIADIEGYYSALPNPWTSTTPSLDPAQSSGQIVGASCVSSTSCVGVGTWNARDDQSRRGPLIERLSAGTWSRTEQTTPNAHTERELTAVSCVSTTSCVAVGYDSLDVIPDNGPYVMPIADVYANGTWTVVRLPQPNGRTGEPAATAQLEGISCVSATECVAVGGYNDNQGDSMFVENWNGTSWSAASLALPAGYDMAGLTGVSCTADGSCVASGAASVGPDSYVGLIETRADGQWTANTAVGSDATHPTQGFDGVSCAAAGHCVAVSSGGTAATLDGGSWSVSAMPSGMTAVSCAATDACTAVGSYFADQAGDSQPTTAEWDGTTWTQFGLPRLTGRGHLDAVSCVGATSCVAGGGSVTYTPSAIQAVPLLESDLAT